MDLMAEIGATRVERATMAVWFLGQNGWVVKSPSGRVLVVDPYLSDSCNPSRRSLDTRRQVPVLVAPDRLEADLLACTHSHRDHADPGSLCPICRGGRVKAFLGPAQTQAVFAAAGAAAADCRLTWPGDVVELGDIRLTGTFALPTDTSDLTHMGFLVQVDDGPKLWITGDTAWCDLLAEEGARHAPDAIALPINGGYANLSHWEAAELTRRVAPRLAIPCHWDMFADNSCDPRMFAASLTIKGVSEKYCAAQHGKKLVITLP
jgi:L-ascorbate 6-phosphate lactonase